MKYRLALTQFKGNSDKLLVKEIASRFIDEASATGANIICLPEMWNCPYSNEFFREYSEPENGPTVEFLSEEAKKHKVYLVGGAIPEIEDNKVYNTSFVFSPKGELIGKHRKVHLFDIDIPSGIRFMESETLSAGEKITVVDTEYGKVGVAICYDVRFPKMFQAMRKMGVDLVLLPAAFNMTTGPAHWDILMKSRALDNQIYFAACSPARDSEAPYTAYGHSCIVNPYGEFCAKTDSREAVIYTDIDTDYVSQIREQIPISKQETSLSR